MCQKNNKKQGIFYKENANLQKTNKKERENES
jgi:hypothetical protein